MAKDRRHQIVQHATDATESEVLVRASKMLNDVALGNTSHFPWRLFPKSGIPLNDVTQSCKTVLKMSNNSGKKRPEKWRHPVGSISSCLSKEGRN
jgi:hypothetical protein